MKSIFNPYKILNHFPTIQKMVDDNKTFPIAVEIDLTNRCNHQCVWCMFEGFKGRKPFSLEKSLVFDLLQELKTLGVKAVTYVGGGEPTLHRDFDEILEYTWKLGFSVGLVTNGELVYKKIDVIKKCCEFVRISLDAGNKRTHDKLHSPIINKKKDITAPSSFTRIIRGLRKLCKNKGDLKVGVAFLVHPDNFFELPDLTNLLIVIGVDYLQIRPVYMKSLTFTNKMLKEVNEKIEHCLKLAEGSSLHVIPLKKRFLEFNGEDLLPTRCLAHNILAIICADGKVYLCCQLRGHSRFELGDLNKESFRDLWKGEQRQKAIEQIDVSRCPPCRYKTYNKIMDYLASERRHSDFL